jgi:predicted  nucleic acid-binding Zn-ribbon protein
MTTPERTPEEIRKILANLVDLQEIDREIIQTKQQMKVLPPKLRALDTRLSQEQKEADRFRESGSDRKEDRRRLEQEVKILEEDIEKHRARLMDVKTNKEYAAVNHEIDSIRRKIDGLETRILEMIEDEEDHQQQVAQAHERLDRIRAEVEEERQRIEEQVRSKKEKLERLAADRERHRTKIPPDVLAMYERLSERLPGSVVVPAIRNHCGGCHLSLVSQKMVEIRQMNDFVRCEGCLRLFTGEAEE